MNRVRRAVIVVAALLVVPMVAGTQTTSAQSPAELVSATARCIDATAGDPARVEVAIDNKSGMAIVVSYVHGFTTAQASNPLFAMTEPAQYKAHTIQDGDQLQVEAPWDDLREHKGNLGAAVVVTNLGLLMPACDEREVGLVTTPHSVEILTDMSEETYAAIAEETYGMLQTWHAYPAMFAMLHPDSQEAVTWGKFVCANAREHGTAGNWVDTVFKTEIVSVQFRDFNYGVTGKHYDEAVQINFHQEIGSIAKTRTVGYTTFFVLVDGQYRPFYGNDSNLIAQFPDTCDLGDA